MVPGAIEGSAYGLKSVIVMDDMAAKLPDGTFNANGVFFGDERAAAIVNTGNLYEAHLSPPVERVIGHYTDGAYGTLTQGLVTLFGQGGQLGNTNVVEVKY